MRHHPLKVWCCCHCISNIKPLFGCWVNTRKKTLVPSTGCRLPHVNEGSNLPWHQVFPDADGIRCFPRHASCKINSTMMAQVILLSLDATKGFCHFDCIFILAIATIGHANPILASVWVLVELVVGSHLVHGQSELSKAASVNRKMSAIQSNKIAANQIVV